MAAVAIRNKQWDVDGDGVACLITPGIPTSTMTQIPSAQMDRVIARLTEEKDRLVLELAEVQARHDAAVQLESDMIALRATVTAEP